MQTACHRNKADHNIGAEKIECEIQRKEYRLGDFGEAKAERKTEPDRRLRRAETHHPCPDVA